MLRFPAYSSMKIRNKLLLAYIGLLIPMFVVGGLGTIHLARKTIRANIEADLQQATETIVNLVETTATAAIKNHLKAVADYNLQITELFYRQALAGQMSMDEARGQIRHQLLAQVIGETGYIYCVDSMGIAVVHPNSKVEGNDFSHFPFVYEQTRRKEGYIEYDWRNPGESGTRAKALYMVYFEPFDWIISVSTYRDEFKSLLPMEDIRNNVRSFQFGPSGYVFVADRSGRAIIHPQIEGANVFDLADTDTRFFEAMRNQNVGRLTYNWRNPGEAEPREKVVFFGSIPEFDWIVGSSGYLDEIYAPIKRIRNIILFFIAGAVFLCVVLTLWVAARITHPVRDLMATVARGREGDYDTRAFPQGNDEIGHLGEMFNAFMSRLQTYHRDLKAEIEEHRRTEAYLQQSRLKFQGIFNQTFQLIGVLDPDGTVSEVNQTALDFAGVPERDVVGRPFWETPYWTHDPKAGGRLRDAIQRAARGEFCRFETTQVDRDGRRRHVDFSLKPVRDPEGHVVMLIPEGRDITERKEAEDILRVSEEKYRQVVENAHDAIIVSQARGIRYANRSAETLFGYSQAELLKCHFEQLIHADDRSLAVSRHKRRLAGDVVPNNCSIRVIDKAGEVKWIELNAVRIEWEGRPALISFSRDITSQKRLESQLLQSQKMEAVGTLAGGIAHDFNNSLQAISGFTQLLLMDESKPLQDREMLATIQKAARHAEELTRQLLTFSHKIESKPVPLNLNVEIRETCRLLERTLPKMIRIETRLKEDLSIVRVDKVQLEQVIMNLGINAGHAMPDGGRLTIETDDVVLTKPFPLGDHDTGAGRYVLLTVTDTGIGMDDQTQQYIFDPFFTTRETGSGTGLGLAMVYGIVTGHGGWITCESALGKGTTFRIYFPAAGLVQIDHAVDVPEIAGVGGAETILIVDDEPVVRSLGRRLLERFGYTVLEAASGEEGLEIYHRLGSEIALVILDLNMPGMGGANCLTHLMAKDKSVRVIIASGYSPDAGVAASLKQGARGFVAKPYQLEDMLNLIREVLDQSEFSPST